MSTDISPAGVSTRTGPVSSVLFDPHVHSEASYDGHEPVELILEHAADIGLDAVAITDHDVMHASLEARDRAPEYGIVAVPGVEVSTRHGHLLALGVEELPPVGAPFGETVAAVRELGGIAVVPHPFQRTRHGVRRRHIADCDAVEVYNAWLFTGYRNRRARAFADRNGYPGVAGSDAHRLMGVGRAYTEIDFPGDRELDASAVVEAVRDGATAVHGRRAPFHRSAGHYLKGAGRKTAYAARRVPSTVVSALLG
jgi:predicted metal-dependent phosphoesterase TrpH